MCAINIFIICILGVVPGFTQEDQKLPADSLGARVDEGQGWLLLNQVISGMGGNEKFSSVKSMEWEIDLNSYQERTQMSMTTHSLLILPDRLRVDVTTPDGQFSTILNGNNAWLITPRGKHAASQQLKDYLKSGLWSSLPYLFARADRKQIDTVYGGVVTVDRQKCHVILITPKHSRGFKLFVSEETLLPVKMSHSNLDVGEKFYMDYANISDFRLPSKFVLYHHGKKQSEGVITKINFNINIDEARFTAKYWDLF